MWQNARFVPNQNVSFQYLMEQGSRPSIPIIRNISDVENALIHNQQMTTSSMVDQKAIPQFFQNWGMRMGNNNSSTMPSVPNSNEPLSPPVVMPTQEQLEKHTAEIMRNAILRKNQQYHDEKFQQ